MKYLISFLLLLVFASGCSDNSDRIPVDTKGRDIKIGITGSPENLNPFLSTSQGTVEIRDIVFRSLYDWDDKWNMVPQIAKKLPSYSNENIQKSSSGTLSMKIPLNSNQRWSNGVYLSGGDFIFANQIAVYPSIAEVNDWWTSKIQKLQSSSEYELEFTIKSSDYSFIPYFKPLPKYAIEDDFLKKTKQIMTNASKIASISCGPYTLKNVSIANEKITNVRLIRNEEFTVCRPNLASLEFCYYPKETFESALFAGVFDFVPKLTFDQAKLLGEGEQREKFNIFYYENTWLHILYLNTSKISDLNLRKAIFKSIDRKALAGDFHSGKASPAMSYLHKKDPSFLPAFKDEKENVEALLIKAGYQKTKNGIWSKNGKGLIFKIAYRDIPINKKIFKNLTKQFEQSGIKVEKLEKNIDNKIQPDLVLDVAYAAPTVNPIEKLSGPKNIAVWSNEEGKEIYKSYISNFDIAFRKELLKRHQLLTAKELPCIPLFFDIDICASKKDISNISPRGFGSNMWNVEYWEDNPSKK